MVEDLIERMWTAALDGDDHGAADLALAALDDGLPAQDLLLDVIAPVQSRVGTAWAANEVTVAQEHLVSGVNERVLAAAARHPAARARHDQDQGQVTVACVEGEWHGLPARLLAEVLRLNGWRVDFLGPHVSTPYLPIHVYETEPDAVALSASMATRLPVAHEAIAACRRTGRPVLAGGAAFGGDGRYARLLGADGWAADGRGAAECLATGPSRVADPSHHPGPEYGQIMAMAHDVVGSVMWKLGELLPELAAYTGEQLKHTRRDIEYIVSFLAVSRYVHDPELFSRFLLWTAGILTARGVPETTLFPALDLIAARLGDLPGARATVAHGQEVLRDAQGKDKPRHPW